MARQRATSGSRYPGARERASERGSCASRSWPCSVRIDSGWNCTPSIGSSRWRRPITRPSSDSALTSSTSGTRVALDDERVVPGGGERARAGRRTRRCRRGRSATSCRASPAGHARPRRRRAGRCTGGRGTRRARARRPRRSARIASFDTPTSSGCVPGSPGPGDTSTASGSSATQLVERDRVVTVDDRLGAELPEVLHEVVDERVVVVDHQHPRSHIGHGTGPVTAARRRVNLAQAVARTTKSQSNRPPPHRARGTRRPRKAGKHEPAVGAGHDVHLPGARRGGDRRATTCSCSPAARRATTSCVIGLVLLIIGFVLSTFFR